MSNLSVESITKREYMWLDIVSKYDRETERNNESNCFVNSTSA